MNIRRNLPLIQFTELLPVALLAVLSIFFQFFTEWLFFVTKPSFFSALSAFDRFLVLLSAPLIPSVLALLAIFLFGLAKTLLKTRDIEKSFFTFAGRLIPTFFFSASLFLMLDNFTNVMLDFGIASSGSWAKTGYAAIFVLISCLCFRAVSALDQRWQVNTKLLSFILALILTLSTLATTKRHTLGTEISLSDMPVVLSGVRPNILLFGGDSLEALSMSAYGYQRDTTPFIHEFMKEGLVFENAFANGSQTAGSLTSILTGKLPTQTRVHHEPDFLKDEDSYQHLPGILKKLKYRSAQFTIRIYGDAYDLNLKSSFDEANFRSLHGQQKFERLADIASQETIYFLRQTFRRITERLLYVFHLKKMIDPFSIITQGQFDWYSDTENINGLLSFIGSSEKPFFAHIHLLAPHGNFFAPQAGIFSSGRQPTQTDLYDDRVRTIDDNFKTVVDFLERSSKLDQTLIVFYSDHPRRGDIKEKIPLIVWFPKNDHASRVTTNAQLIDIAPTILDYMDLRIPAWMEGRSLLSAKTNNCQPILSASAGPWDQKFSYVISKPPFFSLWKLTAIVCNRYYMFDLLENRFIKEGFIAGHTGECGRCRRTSKANIHEFIVEHLSQNGYDTSSIDTNGELRVKQ